MGGAVHADTNCNGEHRLAFSLKQNAGDLGRLNKQIVRPLHLQVGPELRRAGGNRIMHCERRNKGQLGANDGGEGLLSNSVA